MNQTPNKLRIIPKSAWPIGIVLFVLGSLAVFLFWVPRDPQLSAESTVAKIAFSICVPATLALFALYVFLIIYICRDAKRRGMRYVMWTLLAIFIPNAVGIILYFILRDPLPTACPTCGVLVKSSFTFCPHCATGLRPTCSQCGHAIESNWSHCPHCGTAVSTRNQSAAPAAQPVPPSI